MNTWISWERWLDCQSRSQTEGRLDEGVVAGQDKTGTGQDKTGTGEDRTGPQRTRCAGRDLSGYDRGQDKDMAEWHGL